MKKITILSLFIILFVAGCGKDEYINCSIDINNNVENYNLKGNYKIYYKNTFVTRVQKEEEYTSDNKNIIDYFYESKQLEYYDLNDKYGGFTYDIKKSDTKVKLNIDINTKEVDLKSMSKDDRINKDYVKSDKLLLSGIKKIYESKGMICE